MKCKCGAEYHPADIKWHRRINCKLKKLNGLKPVSDPEKIGQAMREMRLSLNQTQGFMADLLGISVSQWSAIENAAANK